MINLQRFGWISLIRGFCFLPRPQCEYGARAMRATHRIKATDGTLQTS